MTDAKIVEELTEKVSQRVTEMFREMMPAIIQNEVASALSKALDEGAFYRQLNDQMRKNLSKIYDDINNVKKGLDQVMPADAAGMLSQTEDKLAAIISLTEKATLEIMDHVEWLLEHITGLTGAAPEIDAFAQEASDKLLMIMTALSFQDITGQHIRRTIGVIKTVEEAVLELYVSTGMKIKSRDEAAKSEEPAPDPFASVSQSDIDKLLGSMG
jgi:chemotaxis protein CheZ